MASGGLFLFLGPDRPRKLQRLQELERALKVQPMDRHHVDGAGVAAAELVALCRQRASASPRRLIVVDDAHRLDGGCVEGLTAHAEAIGETAAVVLLVETELSQRHPLARAQGGPEVQVERFAGREAPAAKPFVLTDALGHRDTAGALGALHDQLRAGKEPLELLGLIVWQLNRWVLIRRLCDAGCSVERMTAATGLQPWQVERLQTEVARRPLRALQEHLERCRQLDVDAKSGRANPELAVEELVVSICEGTTSSRPFEAAA
jgi:DNA polymerase III delta subunit